VSTPNDAAARKALPIATGVLNYFPDALLAVAEVSRVGNDQHNPGQPLHWAKDLSTDHADSLLRHLIDAGTLDTDGTRHSAKVAWRALALLQVEIERETSRPKDINISLTASEYAQGFADGKRDGLSLHPPAPEDKLPLTEDDFADFRGQGA
jgi:hypothetical protein